MMRALAVTLDPEQRVSVIILVYGRWLLFATSLVAVDYRPDSDPAATAGLTALVIGAGLLNLLLHWQVRNSAAVPLLLPVVASVYDVAAVTAALGIVDGFRSSSYILYYPALLAFSLVFPGRWSVLFSFTTAVAYVAVILVAQNAFYPGNALDQKVLLLRLATIAATVTIANLVVYVERDRRRRAVTAETLRTGEVVALQQRTLQLERAAQNERRRLSQEVHDGISQDVYMLVLGLETAAATIAVEAADAHRGEQLDALVRLAKQTLLETRNLLFDLEGVMAGERSLAALVQNQAREFEAVTGIAVRVAIDGEERLLPPITAGEVYRVVQEGLANVYKHAAARSVAVQLAYEPSVLRLEIADDGRGFAADGSTIRGYGLRNMRERAERLGGRASIDSTAGEGTRLVVTVPLMEEADGADSPAAG